MTSNLGVRSSACSVSFSLSLSLSQITLSRGSQSPCSKDSQAAFGETHMMRNLLATLCVSLEADILSTTDGHVNEP